MTYVPHTDADRRAMLDAIGIEGVDRLEDLFADVPDRFRFPDLDLPPPASELELEVEMAALAQRNLDVGVASRPCFLGAGAYRHFVPATVDYVLERGELYTAYTPYQPELSQGLLQATFEYQSMICELTGMEVSTASHYDGATALAEAVLVALAATSASRNQVVVAGGVHPQYREVLATYLGGTTAELVPASDEEGDFGSRLGPETAAAVIQSPDFFGQLRPLAEQIAAVHAAGALAIVIPDPIALGLFRSPGEDGADLVAAEGQCLGIPLSFGGPNLGILAATQKLVRRLPGRLVGETVDVQGRRGYVLTLGTREQHIRREKATSNICTNAALMAVAAATYLATVGRSGLRHVAELCYHKSHYAAVQIAAIPGCRINPQAPERPFFKEFVAELPVPAAAVNRILLEEHGIVSGYDLGQQDARLERRLLVAVTEVLTKRDIDRFVAGLRAAIGAVEGATQDRALPAEPACRKGVPA